MRRAVAILTLLIAAGCSDAAQDPLSADGAGAQIETAAIERGLVTAPGRVSPIGVFMRDTDRICVTPIEDGFRIGVAVDYGDGLGCSARGRVTQAGSALRVDLGDRGDCAFDARIEGDAILFPVRIPDGCARFCRGRARLSALRVNRLSEAVAEARALRDSRRNLLCAT